MIWSDAMAQDLRQMWEVEGLTLSRIADSLSQTHGAVITLSSVMSKIKRLKLKKKMSIKVNTALDEIKSEPLTVAINRGDGYESCSLLTIRHNQCRWPIDAFDDAGLMMFCGKKMAFRGFCESHASRVWIKSARR
jgi:hypothetical protein